MRHWSRTTLQAVVISSVLAGCEDPPALRVDDVPFTASQLLGRSETQTDELIVVTAIGIAVARGQSMALGKVVLRPEMEDLLLRRLSEEEALARAGIDEAALQDWYDQNPEPELLVRHFVLLSERRESSEARSSAALRARQGLERVRSGEPFPSVAGEVSEEPGAAARGGLLEPGREGSWVREFWMAANSLGEGEVSDVVETLYGFHVLRLEERRAVPFSEARTRSVSRLVSELALLPSARQIDLPANERESRLAEANRRGLVLTPGEEAEILDPWVARIERWADTFGFRDRMGPEEIAAQAIAAVGLSNQEAMISRRELGEWAEALASAYAIERTSP